MADQRQILAYSLPQPRRPRLATAVGWCAPQFALVLFVAMANRLGTSFLNLAVNTIVAITCITAIGAFAFYFRKPKPWYVVACLAVNAFSLVVAAACALAVLLAVQMET